MKKILVVVFILVKLNLFAQDNIYLTDGNMVMGKITQVSGKKIKFKNLANPSSHLFSRNIDEIQVAFNADGDYMVFGLSRTITDEEKDVFINPPSRSRLADVIVDVQGKIEAVNIVDEGESEITVTNKDGRTVRLLKSNLVFLIRRNGTHQIFTKIDQAYPFLAYNKTKVNELKYKPIANTDAYTNSTNETVAAVVPPLNNTDNTLQNVNSVGRHDDNGYGNSQPTARGNITPITDGPTTPSVNESSTPQPAANVKESAILTPDMALFGKKAFLKTREFTNYLQIITSANTDRDAAFKSINQACDLFLNQGADVRVEVSNVNTEVKVKHKVRDYLSRLMLKSGQFDKVNVEYADINYASEFKKGLDGNYYATITFVQKFQGFTDGNLTYGDITKRSMTIVIKHYEKQVNGESVSGWDLYLGDIGVVETKKI
jgi:hypothetical protein